MPEVVRQDIAEAITEAETMQCANGYCTRVTTLEDSLITEDGGVCSDCASLYHDCYHCDLVTSNTSYIEGLNEYVCEDCYDSRNYFHCDSCDYHFSEGDYGSGGACYECQDQESEGTGFDEQDFEGEAVGKLGRWKDLFIGAEIELISHDRYSLAESIRDLHNDILPDQSYQIGLMEDGSLSSDTGIEIVTPKLKGKAIDKVIDEICKRVADNNGTVNDSCGLHIHVESKNLDDEKIIDFAKLIYFAEPVLFSLQPSSRRVGRWAGPITNKINIQDLQKAKAGQFEYLFYNYFSSVDDELLENKYKQHLVYEEERRNSFIETRIESGLYGSPESIKRAYRGQYEKLESLADYKAKNLERVKGTVNNLKKTHGGTGRYYGTNFQSHFYRGTIEFRYHSGTVNAKKIKHWALLCQSLVQTAIDGIDDRKLKTLENKQGLDKLNYLLRILKIPNHIRGYYKERYNLFN